MRARDSLAVLALALSVLAALGLTAAAAIVGASVEPRFCAVCHAQPARDLAMTAHAGMKCDGCHAGTGAFRLAEQRAAVLQMVASTAMGSRGPQDPVHDDACSSCHSKLLDETVVARGLRMSHREVSEAGIRCVECHGGSAHRLPERAVRGRYDMGGCLECHRTSAIDPGTCATCHVADAEGARSRGVTPWRVTHGANWERTHGMGDLRTCSACHPQTYCGRCHRTEVPHPAAFRTRHGAGVAADPSLEADCFVCHRRDSCMGCHGVEMPHPDGYLKVHESDAKKRGESVCLRCHDERSCKQCHDRHVHPGIPEKQLRELLRNPVRP